MDSLQYFKLIIPGLILSEEMHRFADYETMRHAYRRAISAVPGDESFELLQLQDGADQVQLICSTRRAIALFTYIACADMRVALPDCEEKPRAIVCIPLVCNITLTFDDAPKLFGYIEDCDRTQRPHALTTELFPAWTTSAASWVDSSDDVIDQHVQQIRKETRRSLSGDAEYRVRQVGKHRLHILSWPPTAKRSDWVILSASDNGICLVFRDVQSCTGVSFNNDEWLTATMTLLSHNL
jgi:hypothetical protein